jgi:hypothetical protein
VQVGTVSTAPLASSARTACSSPAFAEKNRAFRCARSFAKPSDCPRCRCSPSSVSSSPDAAVAGAVL